MVTSVPLRGHVKKAMMEAVQADLSAYVVMELRGSKRELSTVVIKN